MTNQIILSVDKQRLSVAPGASVDLAVTAQNLTALLDQVAIRAEGIDPSWVQVIPPYLPVFAQGQATARVVFQPPRNPAVAIAGSYPLRVCATSQETPGKEGDANVVLEVQFLGDYRIWLEKGQVQTGQEAEYVVQVQSEANAPLRLRFQASDDASALWYKFDPFEIEVAPGGKANVKLSARAKNVAGKQTSYPFNLSAQGEFEPKDGAAIAAPVRQVSGLFVQGAGARLTISVQPSSLASADNAEFQVRIGNPGQSPVNVQLGASDDKSELDFSFQPAQVTLASQSGITVVLSVRARSPLVGQTKRVTEFKVVAQPTDGQTNSASALASFTQIGTTVAAPKPNRIAWIILAVMLVFACIAALLFIGALGYQLVR